MSCDLMVKIQNSRLKTLIENNKIFFLIYNKTKKIFILL